MTRARWAAACFVAAALAASPAWAAGGEAGTVGRTLFAVAVLVTSAKIGGLVVERWEQPAVLGELLVGIILGNVAPVLSEAAFAAVVIMVLVTTVVAPFALRRRLRRRPS